MNKQEYKMILKLIDKNSIKKGGRETMYGVTPTTLIIDESGIEQLKHDIKDVFEEHTEEVNVAEYADRIANMIELPYKDYAFIKGVDFWLVHYRNSKKYVDVAWFNTEGEADKFLAGLKENK